MAGHGSFGGMLGLFLELGLLAKAIVLLIVGAFGVGLWAALRLWRFLPQEALALQEVQQRCQRLRERGGTHQELDIADFLTADIQPPTAVVCARIQTLQALHQHGAHIDRDALAATSTARFSLEMSLLRYISGILILIGLMGTLVGLTQAVVGLRVLETASVEREDTGQRVSRLFNMVDNLSNSIRETLVGMRTAFFASLLAVSLTIVLSLCAHLLHNSQTQFLTALEDCTTRDLIPLFVPAKTETVLDTLVHVLQQGTTQLLGVVEELDDRAATVGDNLAYLFTVVREFDAGRQQFEGTLARAAENHVELQKIQQSMQQTTQYFLQALERLNIHEQLQQQALLQLQTFCANNADLPTAIQQALTGQQHLQGELAQFAKTCEDLLGRRLTDLLSQHHQRLTSWSEAHERVNQKLLEAMGQGVTQQQNANTMWHQLFDHYRQDQGQTTTQATLNAEHIARLATVSEGQYTALQNLQQAMQHSLTVQSDLQEAFKVFVRMIIGAPDAFTADAEAGEDKQELSLPLTMADGFRALFGELRHERTVFLDALARLQTEQRTLQQQTLRQQQQMVTQIQRLHRPPSLVTVLRASWPFRARG